MQTCIATLIRKRISDYGIDFGTIKKIHNLKNLKKSNAFLMSISKAHTDSVIRNPSFSPNPPKKCGPPSASACIHNPPSASAGGFRRSVIPCALRLRSHFNLL
uniref:Uncharacterized protein n=1 Tax=Romanomermis culicivorax TaxID=13658 RepID=A0A915KY03_ROMCU